MIIIELDLITSMVKNDVVDSLGRESNEKLFNNQSALYLELQ